MGLDNFWVATPDSKESMSCDLDPPLELCGGLFSDRGSGSFRGKVYNDYVQSITGVSLYEDVIHPETIEEMALKLEKCIEECQDSPEYCEDLVWNERKDLARMFRYYADRGAYLVSWY